MRIVIVLIIIAAVVAIWHLKYESRMKRYIRFAESWKGPGHPPFIVIGGFLPTLWRDTDPDEVFGLEYVEAICSKGRAVVSVYHWSDAKLDQGYLWGSTTPD